MKLRSYGLTAGQAAAGIDQSRSTLYRWAKAREPKSRRPHRLRQKTWTPALMRAVERIRLDNPMWGKDLVQTEPGMGLRGSLGSPKAAPGRHG